MIFRTSEEAIDQLCLLKSDRELRERMGVQARRKVEALIGPEAMQRLLSYYLIRAAEKAA